MYSRKVFTCCILPITIVHCKVVKGLKPFLKSLLSRFYKIHKIVPSNSPYKVLTEYNFRSFLGFLLGVFQKRHRHTPNRLMYGFLVYWLMLEYNLHKKVGINASCRFIHMLSASLKNNSWSCLLWMGGKNNCFLFLIIYPINLSCIIPFLFVNGFYLVESL